jgi:hypothetical protein
MHPLVTVEHRQRLLKFGLQFGSDFRNTATVTGLTPAPARFGVCLCPTLFVITFKVLIRYGDIIQKSRLFVKGGYVPLFTNLFPVFSPVFVYLAHPFVRPANTLSRFFVLDGIPAFPSVIAGFPALEIIRTFFVFYHKTP